MQLAVVIPTLGRRPAELERAVRACAGCEVVVARDAAAAPVDVPARVVQAARPGASAARNAGWRATEADVVLFVDDDVVLDPGAAAAHRAAHLREPAEHVATLGPVRWADGARTTPFMRWLDRGIQFDFGSIEGDDAGWGRFVTANGAMKRSLLERLGGFDEERLPFGYEDLDLAKRAEGLVVRYVRDAGAQHLHAPTLEEWTRRVERIARAEAAFCAKHPDAEPWFAVRFAPFEHHPRPSGRAVRLAALVGERGPLRAAVDNTYRALLAPAFMRAWRAARSPR